MNFTVLTTVAGILGKCKSSQPLDKEQDGRGHSPMRAENGAKVGHVKRA